MDNIVFFISNWEIFEGRILKQSKKGAFWISVSENNSKLVSASNIFKNKLEVEKELEKRTIRKQNKENIKKKEGEEELEKLFKIQEKFLLNLGIEIKFLDLMKCSIEDLEKKYNQIKKIREP